ncbi:MAG TPA: radical SAM protein, partial [Thermoanaerobaculia bacterium]|nr:radical SAM protein [Thermoanaerobaculia bacterium]
HLPTLHPRTRGKNRYVYAVRARRSRGISVGINLDPQKTCNFDCVYCEVIDRREIAKGTGRPAIAIADVARELAEELASRAAGSSAADPVRDIAFAGDGEPSTFRGFLPLVRALFDVRDAAGFRDVPFVLITNGSGLARDEMREAHDLFGSRGGAFWIKLDAGTEGFYKTISRSAISFERILANLTGAAKRHPVVVQAMFLRLRGEPPPRDEIATWASRLAEVRDAGGRLSLVQVYTIARETMEPGVTALTKTELEDIAAAARAAAPGVPVETFV